MPLPLGEYLVTSVSTARRRDERAASNGQASPHVCHTMILIFRIFDTWLLACPTIWRSSRRPKFTSQRQLFPLIFRQRPECHDRECPARTGVYRQCVLLLFQFETEFA